MTERDTEAAFAQHTALLQCKTCTAHVAKHSVSCLGKSAAVAVVVVVVYARHAPTQPTTSSAARVTVAELDIAAPKRRAVVRHGALPRSTRRGDRQARPPGRELESGDLHQHSASRAERREY